LLFAGSQAARVCARHQVDGLNALHAVKATPSRFTKTSPGRSWNTGNGSPDAICMTVDNPGVVLVGFCLYGGGGIHEYELEVLADNVSHLGIVVSLVETRELRIKQSTGVGGMVYILAEVQKNISFLIFMTNYTQLVFTLLSSVDISLTKSWRCIKWCERSLMRCALFPVTTLFSSYDLAKTYFPQDLYLGRCSRSLQGSNLVLKYNVVASPRPRRSAPGTRAPTPTAGRPWSW